MRLAMRRNWGAGAVHSVREPDGVGGGGGGAEVWEQVGVDLCHGGGHMAEMSIGPRSPSTPAPTGLRDWRRQGHGSSE